MFKNTVFFRLYICLVIFYLSTSSTFAITNEAYRNLFGKEINQQPSYNKYRKNFKSKSESEEKTERQYIIFGMGLGIHNFNTNDDYRTQTDYSKNNPETEENDTLKSANMGQVYLEFYLLDKIGIGFLAQNIIGTRATDIEDENTTTLENWNIRTNFITLNLILFDINSSTRFGIKGGLGNFTYSYNKDTEIKDKDPVTEESIIKGTAQIVGLFLDFGGNNFGVRIGANQLTTSLNDLKDEEDNIIEDVIINSSGISPYIDLRFSW